MSKKSGLTRKQSLDPTHIYETKMFKKLVSKDKGYVSSANDHFLKKMKPFHSLFYRLVTTSLN